MANWSNPTLTSLYTDFLTQLKDRDTDLALQFDGTTSTNLTAGTIRWNSSINRWQKWSGSAWGELASTYALTGLSTTGNASIGGTLTVTGSTSLAAATATTPATADNSTAIATTAWVKAQGYSGTTTGTSTNTPNTLVQRDASGNFAAGALTLGSFTASGNSSIAATLTLGGSLNVNGAGINCNELTLNGNAYNLSGTGFFQLPRGTTAQRPSPGVTGYIRFNTTLGYYEGYNGSAWVALRAAVEQGTAAPTTSGTAIDFTNIPSWATRITVLFNGVSTSGTSPIQIQLGTSSGFLTSGYQGAVTLNVNATGDSAGYANGTGFAVELANGTYTVGGSIRHAALDLFAFGSNRWIYSGRSGMSQATGAVFNSTGNASLASALTQIRITTVNGTDTFDLGSINIQYAG